ncbi:hypothetical protein ACQEVB_16580 [Pseudonocardia sp. CA-107938]|uniref:hypothetical protein n=1 Tax=Pseudonocardia sp. CA-107938 TaxID=3240021 RepID=UPI003D9378A0
MIEAADMTDTPNDGEQMCWSAPVHLAHAGRTFTRPRPVLLDRAWPYEPESCLTGVRVVALRVADGTFVCPLCGVLTT